MSTKDANMEHARIMEENKIAKIVLDATFKIHKK